MKTPNLSKLTVFLAGTTVALLFAFGLQALSGPGKIQESLTQVGQELLPEALAGFDLNSFNLYSGYLGWPNSTTLDTTDTTAQSIALLYTTTANTATLADINGDGLVDILFHKAHGSIGMDYGIFLNNGGLGFTWAYKCTVKENTTPSVYYGDCAG